MSAGNHQKFEQLELFTDPQVPDRKMPDVSEFPPMNRPVFRLIANISDRQIGKTSERASQSVDFPLVVERLMSRAKFF